MLSVRKFIFLFIVLVNTPMYMMGRIAFAYDEAGNRIKRELVITPKNIAPGNSAGVNENFYDSIGDKSVTLTSDGSGIVHISINNFIGNDLGYISVYSISGIIIMKQVIEESHVHIDLSSCSNGVYILSVIINKNQTTWKITKK